MLTAGTAIPGPGPGSPTGASAPAGARCTAGEGTHNLPRAHLAVAVLAGLLANTLFGAWRLNGGVALVIAAWAVVRGGHYPDHDAC